MIVYDMILISIENEIYPLRREVLHEKNRHSWRDELGVDRYVLPDDQSDGKSTFWWITFSELFDIECELS